jgi:hypothetical protein
MSLCLRGHDARRDNSGRCLRCKADAMWEYRHRQEAERLAEEQKARLAETERRRKAVVAKERAILAAGGPEALDLMQRRAFEDGKCGWYEDDDVEVCQRRTDPETFVWCRKHNRELDRRQEAKRRPLPIGNAADG